MSETKHTPGPWIVRPHFFKGCLAVETASQPGKQDYICGVDLLGILREEEGIANAHLIAAAPEMLEALKKVDEIFYHYLDPVHPLSVKIKDAIAKAEGRENP